MAGPGTAPLAPVPELEELVGSETSASGTGRSPAAIGPRRLGDAPSGTSRRCTGSAGAEAVAGATGPAAGRADGAGGDGGALGRPPAAGERCTRGVWPGAGAPVCRRTAGAAAGLAA
ncbi:hypothetical protein ACWD04_28650 [Streptomyces sp. NPDC002911]